MRVLLLVNDAASSVTARTRVLIHTALNDRHDVALASTSRRGHAARLARGAAADGTDVVVVLGGDGTLNEAANGLAGTRCALAALPGGSTNVYARTIGTDDDPLAAAAAICDALDDDRIEAVGLGEARAVPPDGRGRAGYAADDGGRLFLFHCGIGFDAAVVALVERWPRLKRYAAHPFYLAAATATWLRRRGRARPAAVHCGAAEPVESHFTVVLNTDPYTYLGARPVSLAPGAGPHNGLSVVALRSLALRDGLRAASAALRGGGDFARLDDDVVHRVDDVSEATVRAAGTAFDYQIDGEYLGRAGEIRFTHHPRMLPVVIPERRS